MSGGARLSGLLMLYGSRLAGIVVSLFFLPLYARLLGTSDFGWAAMILAGQTLMAMLDLGMAALTTRDLAAAPDGATALRGWRRAEHLLSLYFSALCVVAMAVAAALGQPIGLAAAVLALFWALTLQNLSQAAMIARGHVQQAALLQGAGVMARALLSAAVLVYVEASLRAFVASQLVGALLHLAASRHWGQGGLGAAGSGSRPQEPLALLARRGLPLFLVGAAGAAVLQADKLIVGIFMSPQAVAPYFLASTFCMAPIAILAGPVAQFFQPRVIRAHASGDPVAVGHATRQLTLALLATVTLPTAAIWLARAPAIQWWLHDAVLAEQVAHLASVLLPAAAIGAIGNVPVILLNAQGDLAMIARVSTVATLLTLAGAAVAASLGALIWICWIYLAYYLGITAVLWLRCRRHPLISGAAGRSAWLSGSVGAAALAPLALLYVLRS